MHFSKLCLLMAMVLFGIAGPAVAADNGQKPKYSPPVLEKKISSYANRRFPSVGSIAVDNDDQLFVAAASDRRVIVFDSFQEYKQELLGSGKSKFLSVTDIFVIDKMLYVVDSVAFKIYRFEYSGGTAVPDTVFDLKQSMEGAEELKSLWPPSALVVDTKGRMFVGHRDVIVCYDENGDYSFKVGSGVGSGKGELKHVRSLDIDFLTQNKRNRLYVTEMFNYRVQVFEDDGSQLDVNSDQVVLIGRRGAGDGMFAQPTAVAVDKNGLIYVSDRKHSYIQVFSPKGKYLYRFGDSPGGVDLVITPNQRLYWSLADKRLVMVYKLN